ncbi:hypothetical protein EON77_18130, partial [bacterium]
MDGKLSWTLRRDDAQAGDGRAEDRHAQDARPDEASASPPMLVATLSGAVTERADFDALVRELSSHRRV